MCLFLSHKLFQGHAVPAFEMEALRLDETVVTNHVGVITNHAEVLEIRSHAGLSQNSTGCVALRCQPHRFVSKRLL